MLLRVMGAGLAGVAVVAATAAAAGATVACAAALACAARRRGKARAAWPKEEATAAEDPGPLA
jgi:predicted homoserine dehydrogenase-like protein